MKLTALLALALVLNNAQAATAQTLFTTQVPAYEIQDRYSYELGMQFIPAADGQITAIRFWKLSSETGIHVGHLWTATGQLLASVTFAGETASGWQQQALTTPVNVTAGTTYVVSVNNTNNAYPLTYDGLAAQITNGSLRVPAGGGMYFWPGQFPALSSAHNMFRDVVFAPPGSPPSVPPPQPPSTSWASQDIGNLYLAGSASQSGGTITVAGTGRDIGDPADEFHYVYQSVTGDMDIVARVASLEAGQEWAKAGVMIRAALTDTAAHAFMFATGTKGWVFQRRLSNGGSSYLTPGGSGYAPGWVRLTREGNLFSAYTSADGGSWTLVGTDTIPMPATVSVGLAVTSHNIYAAATATFTNVAILTPSSSNQPPSVAISSPASGASYTAPATIAISAAASDVDGSVTRVDFYANGQFVGSDTTSPFAATWSNVAAGSYTLTAVATDNGGRSTSSAPITVTVGTTPSASSPSSWTSQDIGNLYLAGSDSQSGGTFTVAGTGRDIGDPADEFHFVYQSVTGDTDIVAHVTSFQAGQLWAKAGVMIRTSLTDTAAYASMFVTGGSGWAFERRLSDGGSSSLTPVGSGYAPAWVRLIRAGNVFTAYVSTDGASWTPVGTNTIAMPATVYIGLAVTSHNIYAAATATFTNVAITTPSSSNQPPSVAISSPASGASYTAPATMAISAAASDVDGSVTRVDFYANGQLVGSDTTSPFTATWSNVAAGTYTLTAVATDNGGRSASSAPITVTVGTPPPAPIQSATLYFEPPANYATYVDSCTVEVRRASDGVTVATSNLGKPAVVNGEATADITALVSPLPSGSYYAVVIAIGPGGTTPGNPSAVFVK